MKGGVAMFNLNYGDRRPLYMQITEKFRELILTGVMKEGEKFPSVRELAANLAINPNTIQKAYKELENAGFLLSVPAKGSFVAPVKRAADPAKIEELRQKLRSLVREMRFAGAEREFVLSEIEEMYKEDEKP